MATSTKKKPPAHDVAERRTTSHDVVTKRPRVIALTGQKGGAGKTTVAISVAVEAASRGLRVLLLDVDPQGSCLVWADAAEEAGRSTPCSVAATILGVNTVERVVDQMRGFDLVVIDCPPALRQVQRTAMMLADVILLPCGPTALDVGALERSLDLVKEARAAKPSLIAAVVVTRLLPRTKLGREIRSALEEHKLRVLAAACTFRVAYQEFISLGMGPTTYEPDGPAAAEVRALVTELEGLS